MNFIELGPVPANENCAQVGSPDDAEASRCECKVFCRMLERLFPVPMGLPVSYVTRTHAHDFGDYREVSIQYGSDNGAAADFAHQVEISVPDEWDAIARYELVWYERRSAYLRAQRDGSPAPDEIPLSYRGAEPPSLPTGTPFAELLAAHPL